MLKTRLIFLCLTLMLAACTEQQPTVSPSPAPVMTVTLVAVPTQTVRPAPTATATQSIDGELFSKITRSFSVLHLKCDPLEIIFDVTVKDPNVKGVVFYFRMKDKATGLMSAWLAGGEMRPVGNNMYEFNFRASAIPMDSRYWDAAWLQYQFVGLDGAGKSLGNTQIFEDEITYTPKCP